MKQALESASTKLSKYYEKTHEFLGYTYGKATLLHPKSKDKIFKKASWKEDDNSKPWAEIYWDALREDFDLCTIFQHDESSQFTDRPKPTFDMPDNLDAILHEEKEEIEDEFSYYQKNGNTILI